ncbi:1,2-phenylacetyl-CoA epoxidase subunit PaaD [Halomarina litorea]|uniref:1,2-phenylacetyl-CoA epoxidase subunit PaaD n=1 Tax=Halomarina litorea TaxID=2961595 RepID=UPI0020C39D22|nr:1,2-phenylacetyl-CoA epoxidase subunit PaaD [Halomarina sp. BCD28]
MSEYDTSEAEFDDLDATLDGEGPTYCAYTDYTPGKPAAEQGIPATGEGSEGLEHAVWDALYEVEDPEMPVSVVDLGLIYGVLVEEVGEETVARVRMTLTYTGCPARSMLMGDIEEAAASPEGVDRSEVELVWSPEWSIEFVTEAGREDLREFGVSI